MRNSVSEKEITVTPSTRVRTLDFHSIIQVLTFILFSQWSAIQEIFDNHHSPAILHRSSSTNTTNPFGPTFCHLVNDDMIFEVMSNGYIASVSFFNERD